MEKIKGNDTSSGAHTVLGRHAAFKDVVNPSCLDYFIYESIF
jgi:hypothetical protein